MRQHGISALIIPHTDPHHSEYLAEHWQARRYFSGFTGSAGDLVVTLDSAALWTDSRYFIQAAQQLQGTGIDLMKSGLDDTPTITRWLAMNLDPDAVVGLDPWLFPIADFEALEDELSRRGIAINTSIDITGDTWTRRPPLPSAKAFIHEERYAGEKASQKIDRILATLASGVVKAIWISALDEIAWILNLRGSDVECNPVNTCYLFLSPERNILFIEPEKIDGKVKKYLHENRVDIMPYNNVVQFIATLPKGYPVLVDEDTSSEGLGRALGDSRAVLGNSPVPMMKAVKNSTEIEGFRNAMVRDGVAMVKAFKELEERMEAKRPTTEMDVAEILRRHRSQQPLFFDESFETIAGYGPHGAIVHYSATPDTDATLQPCGLLLVDSGAQYLDGTTDITRTIALGTPTAQEKRDFTLVLKGNIALAMAVFPQGTRGIQLDTLAHQYLWRAGQNYLHGTGHGIGHFLNVHEGPQSIRNNGRNWDIPLQAGMVTSDEPGLYREGVHGIRCENVLLTVEADIPGADGFRYLAFETLTLFPFDLSLIDYEIFNADERMWLDAYHRLVYDSLSPHLDASHRQWLAAKTRQA